MDHYAPGLSPLPLRERDVLVAADDIPGLWRALVRAILRKLRT